MTQWSTRLLARHLGIADAMVAKASCDHRDWPWRGKSFRFAIDPKLLGKVTDVVGLYPNPPENAMATALAETTLAGTARARSWWGTARWRRDSSR